VQVERATRGDGAAIHGLFAANLPWIVRIARDFRGRGVPLDDLIAEGCVGLLKAIRHYRPVNGTRFMTYASFWIRKEILFAVGEQPNAIRVPEYSRRRGHASIRALSLDAPNSRDGDGRLVDFLRHPGALPAETIITRERAVRVWRFLRQLSLREQTVIVRRFGLGGGPQQTLKEIARHLGLTSERVRQIEALALSRLQRMHDNRAPRAARSKVRETASCRSRAETGGVGPSRQ
jgi:RNA polymerase sigma factor (sigma-70 family)